MVYGSSLPQLAVVNCNEPSFLLGKIINVNNVHYINMLRDHLQCNPASIPFIPYVHFYLKKHASYWQVWNFHRRLNMKTVISSQRMVPALLSGKATF
jgi:hypothetical protein